MKRLSVRITDHQAAYLEKLATALSEKYNAEVSVSLLVRYALDYVFEADGVAEDLSEMTPDDVLAVWEYRCGHQ